MNETLKFYQNLNLGSKKKKKKFIDDWGKLSQWEPAIKQLNLLKWQCDFFISVESTHEVNGTSEENITVKFTFQDSFVNSFPSLYKNEVKKGSCNQRSSFCSERFVLSDVENSSVTLHITNLSLEDAGLYHLVVLADGKTPLIESNKIYIKVKLWNKTTGGFSLKTSIVCCFCSVKYSFNIMCCCYWVCIFRSL